MTPQVKKPEKFYRARVLNIVPDGPKGPYAVVKVLSKGWITIHSLRKKIWKGENWPQPGDPVEVAKLRQNRGGWSASLARPVKST